MNYDEFIRSKVVFDQKKGFDIYQDDINPILFPHQRDIVKWALMQGRAAIFASFGLGKSFMQLEIMRIIGAKEGGKQMIICPLGVRQEFILDAEKLGIEITFVRRDSELSGDGLYLTNYESVRDGKLNPDNFNAVSLDEASVLRGFGGTKTFREFMGMFAGDLKTLNDRVKSREVKYRFVATATPSPNDYIEMLSYSAFLGVMDVSQGKTRFFKRNSTKADDLTIHDHKAKEFWLWIASWAVFISKPSDLGYLDDGYDLPEMKVNWHCIASHDTPMSDKRGQYLMFRNASMGVVQASQEKRETISNRVLHAKDIVDSEPENNFILWHDLESERRFITKNIEDAKDVFGSQKMEKREKRIVDFSDGKFRLLAVKPSIAGSGCNFQRHCHRAIFCGIGFKFNDFIQAIHRIQRFMQKNNVVVDIIYTEAEQGVKDVLVRKWNNHNRQVKEMTNIVKKHGLNAIDMDSMIKRKFGVDRIVVEGEKYKCVLNDTVKETARMDANSVDFVLTSIPFSTQYEYSPNYADFGHSDTNAHFWEQMEYLIPDLLRVLKPGRIAAIHVKDRIVPGGMTGLGYQTVYPFHMDTHANFVKHGFGYMGMKTIVTDVVRENNQTYRLGWTEQCKDGSKMGVGMPEYLMLFRKMPTDTANSYADDCVIKDKKTYTRSKWQVDAHGFTRSSGDRLFTPEEIKELKFNPDFHKIVFRGFRDGFLQEIYNFDHHVKIGETIDKIGRLPVTFMLLQPPSWSDHVWTDVTRMRTLNCMQQKKGKTQHLCPMQFDIADRAITQFTNEGEVVYDPFGGIMTVPYRAVKLGRYGMGTELCLPYFEDGCGYCATAEKETNTMKAPSLLDYMEELEKVSA